MNKSSRLLSLVSLSLMALAWVAPAQEEKPTKVEGVIVARSGNEIIVEYLQSAELAFLLDDTTKVSQNGGLFNARRTDKSMAALIPGLKVKVEGANNENHQLVAKKITFSGEDLEQAQTAEAANRQANKQLQEQNAELQRQADALKQQNEEQQAELTQHKQEIDAAAARFGQMDDYYILEEVTLLYGNGKVTIEPKYHQPLLDLVAKAQHVNGYMIEIVGYASSSGSAALNKKLSEDRANNVADFLLDQGNVPLTRILAPGAMGESRQIGDEKTVEGQAENRRVVVRLLQNKAVAGVAASASAQ
jgi:outer membrane protein OmpA-like peptidoglycan-associated protein